MYAERANIPVFVTDLGGGPPAIASQPDTSGWFDAHLHISQFSERVMTGERAKQNLVIGAGVDSEFFSPVDGTAIVGSVLFAGRVLPHKGIDTLIRALPDGMTLTVVGRELDAPYSRDLRELAVGKPVSFVADADDRLLLDLYRSAQVVVLPSVYQTMYGVRSVAPELLGQTLLEAMACGKPVICTDVEGPEVVV